MSLIGSLEQFDLANILRRIEVFSKTGLLVAKQGEMWVEFYFRQGQLVCIGPVRANVTLIDRLLQANLLSAQSLPQVKQIVGPSEVNETRIALALINEGYLNREVLRAWASHETSQILQAIFSWPMGDLYFEDDHQTPADRLLIALSVSVLLETLPAAILTPRPASAPAPSTDELTYMPQAQPYPAPVSSSQGDAGPSRRRTNGLPLTSATPGMLNAAQQSPAFSEPGVPRPREGLLSASQPSTFSQPGASRPREGMLNTPQLPEQSPVVSQPITPKNDAGLFNASQLIEDFAFNPAGADSAVSAANLVEDMSPPSFASMNPSGIFGAEIDISAPSQISILLPQPVPNPLPPARIDTSFMTPELVLSPVDLSTLRERNPQVQLTPDQWSLFALVDGQMPLQALCQMLKAPAEQVCMVAGELIAIGLVMPLNPTTGVLSALTSPSARYPMYTPQPMMSAPNAFAVPIETHSQWGNGQNGVSFIVGGGWQQGVHQPSSAYAPVGGYR